MKRILVIDESEVVRETLTLILGRDYVVSQRPYSAQGPMATEAGEEIDLLILGVSRAHDVAGLAQLAARLPFALMLLVDSRLLADAVAAPRSCAVLAKPFNPYQLRELVRQLVAARPAVRGAGKEWSAAANDASLYVLEFPYVPRAVASLARRYAATPLPLLVCGSESGCGQSQVMRALMRLSGPAAGAVVLDGMLVNPAYLAEKRSEIAAQAGMQRQRIAVAIDNLERVGASAQPILCEFISELDGEQSGIRWMASANGDLLERVYRGEYFEALYYKLATLTLRLGPLRERRADIPQLAEACAERYAAVLGLGRPSFAPAALARLQNYLWFGNLAELEAVIARTLSAKGSGTIQAAELLFDFGSGPDVALDGDLVEFVPAAAGAAKAEVSSVASVITGLGGYAKAVDLSQLIHELAHEFKNPMVTIKTFAQLLGERYDDASFRARFQDVVGGDIERMDDLLEAMIEFADFVQPRHTAVELEDRLRRCLGELQSRLRGRQAGIGWHNGGAGNRVQTDENQLAYIIKNALITVLAQVKTGSEIEVDLGAPGQLKIAYLREMARVGSINRYLGPGTATPEQGILPLRLLLVKQLIERNGGRFSLDESAADRDIIRMEFPIAEYGKEN